MRPNVVNLDVPAQDLMQKEERPGQNKGRARLAGTVGWKPPGAIRSKTRAQTIKVQVG